MAKSKFEQMVAGGESGVTADKAPQVATKSKFEQMLDTKPEIQENEVGHQTTGGGLTGGLTALGDALTESPVGQFGANLVEGYTKGFDALDRSALNFSRNTNFLGLAPSAEQQQALQQQFQSQYGEQPANLATEQAQKTGAAAVQGQEQHPLVSGIAGGVGEMLPSMPAFEGGAKGAELGLNLLKVAPKAMGVVSHMAPNQLAAPAQALMQGASQIPGMVQRVLHLVTTGGAGAFTAGMSEELARETQKPGGQPNMLSILQAGAKSAAEATPINAGLGIMGEGIAKGVAKAKEIHLTHQAKMSAKAEEAAFKQSQEQAQEQARQQNLIEAEQKWERDNQRALEERGRRLAESKEESSTKEREANRANSEFHRKQAELWQKRGLQLEQRLDEINSGSSRQGVVDAAWKAAEAAMKDLEGWRHAQATAKGKRKLSLTNDAAKREAEVDRLIKKAEDLEKQFKSQAGKTQQSEEAKALADKIEEANTRHREHLNAHYQYEGRVEKMGSATMKSGAARNDYLREQESRWEQGNKAPRAPQRPTDDTEAYKAAQQRKEDDHVMRQAFNEQSALRRQEADTTERRAVGEGRADHYQNQHAEAAADAVTELKAHQRATPTPPPQPPSAPWSRLFTLGQGKQIPTADDAVANDMAEQRAQLFLKKNQNEPPVEPPTPPPEPPTPPPATVSPRAAERADDAAVLQKMQGGRGNKARTPEWHNGTPDEGRDPEVEQQLSHVKFTLTNPPKPPKPTQLTDAEIRGQATKAESAIEEARLKNEQRPADFEAPTMHGEISNYLTGTLKMTEEEAGKIIQEMNTGPRPKPLYGGIGVEGAGLAQLKQAIELLPPSERNYNGIMHYLGIQRTSDILQQYDPELAVAWAKAGRSLSELGGGMHESFQRTRGKVSFAQMGAGKIDAETLNKGLRGGLTVDERKALPPKVVRAIDESREAIKGYLAQVKPVLAWLQENAKDVPDNAGLGRLRKTLEIQVQELEGRPGGTTGNLENVARKVAGKTMGFMFLGKAANSVIHMAEKGIALTARNPLGVVKAAKQLVVDAPIRNFTKEFMSASEGPITEALEEATGKPLNRVTDIVTGRPIEKSPNAVATVIGLQNATKELGYSSPQKLAEDLLAAREGKGPLARDTDKLVKAFTTIQGYVSDITGSNVQGFKDANVFQRSTGLKLMNLFTTMPNVQARNFHNIIKAGTEAVARKDWKKAAQVSGQMGVYLLGLELAAGDKGAIPKDFEYGIKKLVGEPNWYHYMDTIHEARGILPSIPHLQQSFSPTLGGGASLDQMIKGYIHTAATSSDPEKVMTNSAKALGSIAGAQLLGTMGGGVAIQYAQAVRDGMRGYKMEKVYDHELLGEGHVADIPVKTSVGEELLHTYTGMHSKEENDAAYHAEKSHDLIRWCTQNTTPDQMKELTEGEKELEAVSEHHEQKADLSEALADHGNNPEAQKALKEHYIQKEAEHSGRYWEVRANYWQKRADEIMRRGKKEGPGFQLPGGGAGEA